MRLLPDRSDHAGGELLTEHPRRRSRRSRIPCQATSAAAAPIPASGRRSGRRREAANDRRSKSEPPRFLELSGAGAAAFVLGVHLPGCSRPEDVALTEFKPNVFITLDSSGAVTIIANRAEMGQGIRTGLPMVVADEMEADWARVAIEQSDGTPQYGDQATDGSKSVRMYYTVMREAGASCRAMLEQAAADTWGVALSECRAELHEVRHVPTGRVLSYGELAEAASKLPVPPRESLTLKSPEDVPVHRQGSVARRPA